MKPSPCHHLRSKAIMLPYYINELCGSSINQKLGEEISYFTCILQWLPAWNFTILCDLLNSCSSLHACFENSLTMAHTQDHNDYYWCHLHSFHKLHYLRTWPMWLVGWIGCNLHISQTNHLQVIHRNSSLMDILVHMRWCPATHNSDKIIQECIICCQCTQKKFRDSNHTF
jgi:hypothetical protein